MLNDPKSAQTATQAAAHETLVASLRNAHALEKQVISVLETHIKQLDDYPELRARLTEHVVETRDQARRLEAGLEACGASASIFKDTLLSVMGMGQSSVQGFAEDAVLKATLADMMTEHLEIASYRTLITLADLAGKPELRPRLEETLREEEAMAAWFDENLEGITRRFVELKAAADQKEPSTLAADDAAAPEGEPSRTVWQQLENAKQPDASAGPAPGTADEPTTSPAATVPESQTPRQPREPSQAQAEAPRPTYP